MNVFSKIFQTAGQIFKKSTPRMLYNAKNVIANFINIDSLEHF